MKEWIKCAIILVVTVVIILGIMSPFGCVLSRDVHASFKLDDNWWVGDVYQFDLSNAKNGEYKAIIYLGCIPGITQGIPMKGTVHCNGGLLKTVWSALELMNETLECYKRGEVDIYESPLSL